MAPARTLRLTATIEWDHPLIGRQAGTYDINPVDFRRELAPARTFGFTREVDGAAGAGADQGGVDRDRPSHSDDTRSLTTTLRWPDEFVRHKAGDIVGDLALAGGRVRGAHHREPAQPPAATWRWPAPSRRAGASGAVSRSISARILEIMPHRYPFLLVDRIVELEGDERVVGIKNVTINEPFFQGHFPGHPIMPGVLIIEAMAQVGRHAAHGATVDDAEDKVVYFMSLDNVKFRRPVVPGDQLRFELEMIQLRGRTCRMQGRRVRRWAARGRSRNDGAGGGPVSARIHPTALVDPRRALGTGRRDRPVRDHRARA